MRDFIRRSLLVVTVTLAFPTFAAVDLEAYYVVEIDGNAVGFSVQRNELEPATGMRKISYLLKTLTSANDLEQFVTLKHDKIGRPLSYHYDSRVRDLEQHVDGRAQGASMLLTTRSRDKQKDPVTIPLTPDTFFSSAFGPLLMHKKPQPGQAYAFEAISEEDGERIGGEALVLDVKPVGERRVFRVVLAYQNLKQEMWLLDDGLTLRTESLSLPVRSVLVADPRVALRAVERSEGLVAKFFAGRVAGTQNPVSAGLRVPDKLFAGRPDVSGFKNQPRLPLGLMR